MVDQGLLSADQIETLLREVGGQLHAQSLVGEILLLGGAYMTLVLRAREATKDVDAYFAAEPSALRHAAATVAEQHGLPPDWLNDAVKGFLAAQPPSSLWAEFPGLRIWAPDPAYVFALKALASRPADLADLRFLRDLLPIRTPAEALAVIEQYAPRQLLTARVQYVIEDIFDE